MNIRDRFKVEYTGMRYPSSKPTLNFYEDSRYVGHEHPDVLTEYKISLEICSMFRCNQAQYERARDLAEKSIISMLYSDMLKHVDIALHAISNDDYETAVEELSILRKEIIS